MSIDNRVYEHGRQALAGCMRECEGLDTCHAGHSYVDDQAIVAARWIFGKEGRCAVIGETSESGDCQESGQRIANAFVIVDDRDNGKLRPRSEEHTSELQSLMRISYAVFCLKKTK